MRRRLASTKQSVGDSFPAGCFVELFCCLVTILTVAGRGAYARTDHLTLIKRSVLVRSGADRVWHGFAEGRPPTISTRMQAGSKGVEWTSDMERPRHRRVRMPQIEPAVDALTPAERQTILYDWNATTTDYPRNRCIHELLEQVAAETPGSDAILSEDLVVSYGELNRQANRIARYLQRRGVRRGAIVGVFLPRSPQLVSAILAILKSGAAYLPLDRDCPPARLEFMVRNAGAGIVVADSEFTGPDGSQVIALDRVQGDIAAEDGDNLTHASAAGDLAYVMYTSGSTGEPKGVGVCHRSVVRLVRNVDYVDLGPHRTLLHLAPVAFDASTFEIWGALLNGGRLALAPDGPPDLAQLETLLVRHRVCTLWLTSGLFNAVVDSRPQALRHVEQLVTGGDVLSISHVLRALDLLPSKGRLINGYGPTEGTTFTCCEQITRSLPEGLNSIPIGRPIANTRVYVLDSRLQPVSVGVEGELFIGGDGVATGYLNRPELTADRFIPDPFGPDSNAHLYRTGDQVRWLPDGRLEFRGRIDNQVKVRGYRIELEEIELTLARHPRVSEAIVVAPENGAGERELVGFIVPTGGVEAPTPVDLRSFLRTRLPEYMAPSTFVAVQAFPLTANGKIDRRALAALRQTHHGSWSNNAAPLTPVEEIIAGIWTETLGIDHVGAYDDFHDVGGHSLAAVRIIDRINRQLGGRLELSDLLRSPTVAGLAGCVAAGSPSARRRRRHLDVLRPGGDRSPVVCVGFMNPLGWLSARLPGDVPIWWLKADGLHGLPNRVRPLCEIATAFAADLLRARSVQPPILIGYSWSALVAIEVARQLRDAGLSARLVLIEPTVPWFAGLPADEPVESFADRVSRHLRESRKRTTASGLRYLRGRLAFFAKQLFWPPLLRQVLNLRVALGASFPQRYRGWWYYRRSILKRTREYVPQPYDGDILLAGRVEWLNHCGPVWQPYFTGETAFCEITTAEAHSHVVELPAAEAWLEPLLGWCQEPQEALVNEMSYS
jgi:amino acid adenylation domain-containing protein